MDGFLKARSHILTVLCLGVSLSVAAWAGPGPVVQRPISDFLETQTDGTAWINAEWGPSCYAQIDYLNGLPGYIKLHNPEVDFQLDTRIEGSVKEQPLRDGLARVTVSLSARNAYAWMIRLDWEHPNPGLPLYPYENMFGSNHWDVILYGTPQPLAVGDCHLVWEFINKAGAPIPDLPYTWLNAPPEYQLIRLRFQGVASGPLREASGIAPEGTPGKMIINQVGVPQGGSNNLAAGDGWPIELIELRPVGR